MLGKAILNLHRALLFAALTVALVATGFAHRMPSSADQSLALAMANGATLEDLCADGADGDQHQSPGCLACQIAGAGDLPPALGALQRLDLAFLARITAPRESRTFPRVLDPANTAQGPPVV